MQICTAFLVKKECGESDFPAEQVASLRKIMQRFIEVCQEGLDKNKTLCTTEDDIKFQVSQEHKSGEVSSRVVRYWIIYAYDVPYANLLSLLLFY